MGLLEYFDPADGGRLSLQGFLDVDRPLVDSSLSPVTATVGPEGKRGAWGIAELQVGPGASAEQVNRMKNQLLTLNPELVSTVRWPTLCCA